MQLLPTEDSTSIFFQPKVGRNLHMLKPSVSIFPIVCERFLFNLSIASLTLLLRMFVEITYVSVYPDGRIILIRVCFSMLSQLHIASFMHVFYANTVLKFKLLN